MKKKDSFIIALIASTTLPVMVYAEDDEDLTIPSYEHCASGTATCQSRTVNGQTIYYTINHDTKTYSSGYTANYDTMIIYGPTVEGQSIDIPANAFYNRAYLESYIPSDVYKLDFKGNIGSIGTHAFGYAHLNSIVIPDTVTSIDSEALWNAITYKSESNVLYCPSNLSGCSSQNDNYTVVEYTKNPQTGVYTSGDNTYASAQDMQNNISCSVETGECATKVAQSIVGSGYCATLQACTNLLNMVADTNYSCNTIASCSTYAQNPENNIVLAHLYDGGSAGENGGSGSSPVRVGKRIYTVEEAEKVSKKTGNTFRLRYK